MSIMIDARGKSCPIPVIMAKKEADQGGRDFTISVDNKTAVENLMRFGKSGGMAVDQVILDTAAGDRANHRPVLAQGHDRAAQYMV